MRNRKSCVDILGSKPGTAVCIRNPRAVEGIFNRIVASGKLTRLTLVFFINAVSSHSPIDLTALFKVRCPLEVIFNSFLLVFASEMGDKTQLLALVLARKFRKPWAILAGIFVATILNHALASYAGKWISNLVSEQTLSWILAATFFIFAAWILVPDKEGEVSSSGHFGAFLTTTVAFFIAEMGDKTQLATVALGATYASTLLVTLGTTFGMMASNSLAIFFGEKLLSRIPMKWVRIFACGLFVIFGIAILINASQS